MHKIIPIVLVALTTIAAGCSSPSHTPHSSSASASSTSTPPQPPQPADFIVSELAHEDRFPLPIVQPSAPYPFEMRKKGITGVVKVQVVVSKEGNIVSAVILESPHEELSRSVLSVVKNWRYRPGLRAGAPTAVRMVIPIAFDLEDEQPKEKVAP